MIPHTDQHWTPRDNLEWAAFRYVANELSAEEAAAFETQLADDQAAREAVARCVEMTHAIVAVAEAEHAPVLAGRRRGFRVPSGWIALAGSAAVLAVCVAYWMGRHEVGEIDVDGGTAKRPDVVATDTVRNPARVLAGWLDADADFGVPEATLDGAGDSKLLFADPGDADTTVEGKFDWLVAAVDEAGDAGTSNGKESN